jgi:hypothetical protein
VKEAARSNRSFLARTAFAGFRFPAEVIVLAVRWYLRYVKGADSALDVPGAGLLGVDFPAERRKAPCVAWGVAVCPLRPCREGVGYNVSARR